MQAHFRFSPGVSSKSIAFLKSEVNRIMALAPSDSACDAAIELQHPDSFRSWVRLRSRQRFFESAKMSIDEFTAVKLTVSDLERQVGHWQAERNSQASQGV